MEKNSNRRSSIGHPSLAMFGVLVVVLSAMSLLASSANAQDVKSHNKFVEVIVKPGSGWVSFFTIPGPRADGLGLLSFEDHSYLTLKIDGKLYSNSDNFIPDFNLKYGGVTSKIGDTLRTVWNEGTFDIVQDAYPVALVNSGQIVVQIGITNRASTALAVDGTQYLLDLDVYGNDRSKVLTRWSYDGRWNQYPNGAGDALHGVPPFFMSFEHNMPAATQGQVAMGYTDRADLGLIPPQAMTIGDWNTFQNPGWGWGVPAQPNSPYGDAAILYQWSAAAIPPMSSKPMAKFSYGNGEYELCQGNTPSILVYPHRLVLDVDRKNYIMNPFTVDMLLFNSDVLNTATKVIGTVEVGDSLKITGPAPIVDSAKQAHSPEPENIVPSGYSNINWTVKTSGPLHDTLDRSSNIGFSFSGGGTSPIFLGACLLPIIFEHADTQKVIVQPRHVDSLAPVVVLATGGRYESVLIASDIRSDDSGLSNITWKLASSSFPNAVKLSTPVPFVGCLHTADTIALVQLDSTKGGCLDFTFTDCMSNVTTQRLCVAAHPRNTGVAANHDESSTSVYPNPCRDEVTLRLGYSDAELPSVTVFNEAGDLMSVGMLSRQEQGTIRLDMHSLAAGSYLVRIDGRDWSRNVRVTHIK